MDEETGETLSMQWIHTIDISQIGCRLGGLRTSLSPGQTIALQRGQQKASFRVIWSRHLEAEEYQAGIEAIDYGKNIWARELPLAPIAEDSIEPSWDIEELEEKEPGAAVLLAISQEFEKSVDWLLTGQAAE